ncbi:MAG: SPOR domain-containing protein [Methylophilaceae bacterium]|jgi:cell division protein FtsN|nr:MAG: SPOR domain-containing protein [Methylophilaceae bacterium]
MSKDYKPRSSNTNNGNPFLTGFLVGFLFGIMITVALTMYIQGDTSPFRDSKTSTSIKPLIEPVEDEESTEKADSKDKLDFYTILPKTESTVTEQEIKQTNVTTKKEDYFLQVGSFQNEDDADNLKAKLALQGFEAIVQTATIAEQGTWHRVRVGPLSDIEAINNVRKELLANGFGADLIKVETEMNAD